MADAILSPSKCTAPPLNTVLLWLTSTVERDFEERGAFTQLRHSHAKAFHGATTLHYLSADEAEAVLQDAISREQSLPRGTRYAYRAHIRSVQAAIKDAAERPTVFASAAAMWAYKTDYPRHWRGETQPRFVPHRRRL